MAVGYAGNINYQEQIDKAVAAGDLPGAAFWEQGRNSKIDGMGLNYEKTYDYVPYLATENTTPETSQDKYITDMYDGYTEAQKQALNAAYEQNMNEPNAAAAKIPGQYQSARNQAASQSEIQRANFNEYAAASGLNSGAGGQAQLAMSNQLQSNLSGISSAEADALSDLELQRTQLATKNKNDIAQAIAEGNFKKAQALYDNYWRMDAKLTEQKRHEETMAYNTGNNEFDKAMALFQITQDASLLSKWLTPEQIAALRKKMGW